MLQHLSGSAPSSVSLLTKAALKVRWVEVKGVDIFWWPCAKRIHLTSVSWSIDSISDSSSVMISAAQGKTSRLRKASHSSQVSAIGATELACSTASEESKLYSPVSHGSCNSAGAEESSEGEETSVAGSNKTILDSYTKIWEAIPDNGGSATSLRLSRSPNLQSSNTTCNHYSHISYHPDSHRCHTILVPTAGPSWLMVSVADPCYTTYPIWVAFWPQVRCRLNHWSVTNETTFRTPQFEWREGRHLDREGSDIHES